eukprot:1150275_1
MVQTLVLSLLYAIHTIHGADFTIFVALNGDSRNWEAGEKACTDNDATMIAPSETNLVTECASLIPGTNPADRAWIGEADPNEAYVVKKEEVIKQGKNSESQRLKGVCCAPRFLREFEARRDVLRDAGDQIILDARDGEPLNVSSGSPFDNALEAVDASKSNSEYGLATLVRILYFTDDYNDEIKAAVTPLAPFWMHNGDADTKHNFWSESNMILWSSAAYLLKQKFTDLNVGNANDLGNRLQTLLELKMKHGFFEVNSAVFTPYVMNALLNLADFSEDETIAQLAADALRGQLKEFVENVNNQGAFYPAQARSKDDQMRDPYNQGVFKVAHLLTGKGPDVLTPSTFDAFLATTSVRNLAGVLGSWQPKIDGKTTTHGITISDFNMLQHDHSLNNYDATAFKLSARLHWVPQVAADTIAFVNHYHLSEHPEFKPYLPLFSDPSEDGLSHIYHCLSHKDHCLELVPLSNGATLNQITSVLFKDGPVMLSSFQDYNPRFLGFEQYPFVATTGILSVYAKSGGGSKLSNIHLPYIKQEKNAALIKYDSTLIANLASIFRKKKKKNLHQRFGLTDYKTVTFFFPKSKFDEVRTPSSVSNWILGKENGGYVALWRACKNDVVKDKITCDDDQQVYALFVGSKNEYPNFDAFENVVTQATMASSIDGTKTEHTLTIAGITISLTIETTTAAKSLGIGDMIKNLDLVPDDGLDDSNHYFMPVVLAGCWCVVVLMLYCAVEYRKTSKRGWERVSKGFESDDDEMLFVDSSL